MFHFKKIISAFRPLPNWGPTDKKLKDQYEEFLIENSDEFDYTHNIFRKFMDNLFGWLLKNIVHWCIYNLDCIW